MNDSQPPKPWSMSVKAVIVDEAGRHLLVRRSPRCRHFVGVWEWPGGKLDPGENFATGLVREVREECGLEIALTGLAGASEFEMPQVRFVQVCMFARLTGGALCLSEEHDEFAWVPQPELASWNVIVPMQPVIRHLLAHSNPPQP